MHNYGIRAAIFQALDTSLPLFKGRMLDAGCGKMPYKNHILKHSSVEEYVGLDIEGALEYSSEIKPDFTWDGKKMPFDSDSFDCVIATEVLEHCPEPSVFLDEVFRVLKKDGVFFFTVPFLWNLHEVPHDEYRYTPFALSRLLKNSGFSAIKLAANGGWHASMAQMIGLYVNRAPMSNYFRRIVKVLVYLPYLCLLKKSKNESITFAEGQMITGLNGTCKK
jgi:SAM-dependent methyltransferase